MKKQTLFPLLIGILAAGIIFTVSSCEDDDDTEPKFVLNLGVNPEEAGTVAGAGER